MYNATGGPAYDCVNPRCSGWKWVAAAKDRRETSCRKCGTPFCVEAIRVWPPLPEGGKGKGKGRGVGPKGGGGEGGGARPHHLQGGKGGGAPGPAATDQHDHLQSGQGGSGPKPLGLQAPNHLQGGHQAKGAPKGGAKKPATEKSEQTKQEERLAGMLVLFAGEEDHPAVAQQRIVVEKARREAEERMSPTQKTAALRKELDAASDELADTIVKHQELCEQQRALEEKQEDIKEDAFRIKAHVDELRVRLREQEAKCDLHQRRPIGEQVDMGPEVRSQRDLAKVLSTLQSCSKEKGIELTEEQLAPLRETLGLAWGQACALLSPQAPVPAGDSEDDMQDVQDEQKARKVQRTGRDDAAQAARAAALLNGDDIGDDEDEDEEVVAQAWTLVGSEKARKDFEKLCRQLQCLDSEDVAEKVQRRHNKTQGVAKARAKAKGTKATGSATVQPSPGTPVATVWDATVPRRVSQEASTDFPPLQAKAQPRSAPGTPAQASGTGSLTVQPMAVDSPPLVGESAGSAPPASGQETGSPTGLPSAGGSSSGNPAALPAQGQENGGGGWVSRMSGQYRKLSWALAAHPPRIPRMRRVAVAGLRPTSRC